MFTNSVALAAVGWKIISENLEERTGARQLLLWLGETLEVAKIGIHYKDEKTSYSWTEQVEKVGFPAGDAPFRKYFFPSGSSYWFVEGFRGDTEELTRFLDLLADQWLRMRKVNLLENPGRRLIKKSGRRSSDNPFWVAVSPSARKIRSRFTALSFSTRPLLLIGENGSGKRYLAELIHNSGPEPAAPFSGPEINEKTGTLFVSDWHLHTEKERKGFFHDKRRLIATAIPGEKIQTLCEWWKEKTGDPDSVINIPGLRNHPEDIPLLAGRFLEEKLRGSGLPVPEISPTALEALNAYSWPGNIRELKEVMIRSLLHFDGCRIRISNLPPAVRGATGLPEKNNFPAHIATLECEVIRNELSRQKGNISRTARRLGLSPRQVSWRIKKYGINPREYKSDCQI